MQKWTALDRSDVEGMTQGRVALQRGSAEIDGIG